MSVNTGVQDVSHGEIHKRLLSGLCKEDMIKEYAKWAPIYDSDCTETGTCHKEISARALIESVERTEKSIRVLDAACGTGIPASYLRKYGDEMGIHLKITGVDFSPDMLEEARKKNVYDNIIEADLTEELNICENSFDAFLAVGLFLDGHCGPEVLENITRYVKPGGIGVITVRQKTFKKREKDYVQTFSLCNLKVQENFVADYMEGVKGNYLVLKKKSNSVEETI